MEPASRIAFSYPIYALDVLPDDTIAIAGGGGLMKSGIPNQCAVLSFHPESASLSKQAVIDLPDAAVALATSNTTLHTIIGSGVKSFSFIRSELVPHSSFRHDLRVSSTQEQSAIAASKDSKILVIASDEGHVVTVSLPHYDPLFSTRLHAQGITDLAISHDGSLVATTGRDRSAYLWRPDSGCIVQTVKPAMPAAMRTHVRAIKFCSSQSRMIFTAESNPRKGGWVSARQNASHIHDANFVHIASFKASTDAITAMAVNGTGSLVAVSSSEGHVSLLRWSGSAFARLWSTEGRTAWISKPNPPHLLPVTGIRFSESGKHFFTASADYTVAVWPVRRPTNWRRTTWLICSLISILFGLLVVFVAEDHQLHSAIRCHRGHLQPYLEPHLSKLQQSIRPVVRNGQAQMQSYISKLQQAMEPHLRYAGDKINPYPSKVRGQQKGWTSRLENGDTQLVGRQITEPSSLDGSLTPEDMVDQAQAISPVAPSSDPERPASYEAQRPGSTDMEQRKRKRSEGMPTTRRVRGISRVNAESERTDDSPEELLTYSSEQGVCKEVTPWDTAFRIQNELISGHRSDISKEVENLEDTLGTVDEAAQGGLNPDDKSVSENHGFLNVPNTKVDENNREAPLAQQFKVRQVDLFEPHDRNGAAQHSTTSDYMSSFAKLTTDGDSDGRAFKAHNQGADLSSFANEGDSRTCKAQNHMESILAEDRKQLSPAEHMMLYTADDGRTEAILKMVKRNGIAAGEELVHHVEGKIDVILGVSRSPVEDISQTEHY